MNKRNSFKNVRNSNSLEKIDSELLKITKEWIPEYREKLLKNYSYCKDCRKYYPTKDVEYKEGLHTSEECIFTDAGYGDYDEYAKVTRRYTYRVCPFCKNFTQIKDEYVSTGERTK